MATLNPHDSDNTVSVNGKVIGKLTGVHFDYSGCEVASSVSGAVTEFKNLSSAFNQAQTAVNEFNRAVIRHELLEEVEERLFGRSSWYPMELFISAGIVTTIMLWLFRMPQFAV